MKIQEARDFVAVFNAGGSTADENAAFRQWLTEASAEELSIVVDIHEAMHGNWALSGSPSEEWVMQLERKLDRNMADKSLSEQKQDADGGMVVGVQSTRGGWGRWIAAASIGVGLSAGVYFYVHQTHAKQVDSMNGGGGELLSMTVSNPRGGVQQSVELPDGSKVWLSAGSVLRYPPRFAHDERLVELSGDAFFDVNGDPGRPFRVRIKDAEVDVVGTYFEVMAYDDEPESRTTLLSGAVKVLSGQQAELLRPGDQAVISYPSPGVAASIRVQSGIDTKLVLEWKDGIYQFHQTDLQTVLRVLGRVFDVTVQYQPNTPDPLLDGTLDLHKSLNVSLEQLNGSILGKRIHLKADKKTLTVTYN